MAVSACRCVIPFGLAVMLHTFAADGKMHYVQLPEVESVLTKATGKMQDFAAEASAMQARVAQKQKTSREALAQQKAKYEQKLETQAANNSAAEAANAAIQKHIGELESGNQVIKAETEHLQKDNLMMRDVIIAIQDKVSAAKLFLADSLRLTDDTNVDELTVLEPDAPKPTLEHFLEVAKSDGEPSLLQVSASLVNPSETPVEDMVQLLSNSLADIASAEKEGEAELRAHFLAAFEAGNAQHEKLMAAQETLNGSAAALEQRQAELKVARTRLEATRQQLQQRLHGIRVFSRKVDAGAYNALKSVDPPAAAAVTTPAPAAKEPVTSASAASVAPTIASAATGKHQANSAMKKVPANVSLMLKGVQRKRLGAKPGRSTGKGAVPEAPKQGSAKVVEPTGKGSKKLSLLDTLTQIPSKHELPAKSWFRFPWQH